MKRNFCKSIATMLAFGFVFLSSMESLIAQGVPSEGENLSFLVTFGKGAPKYWGDDDNSQVFFFLIPEEYEESVYIRVFDPSISGKHDQANAAFNSKMKYSVYGGEGTHSEPDARGLDPKGKYKSGKLLTTKTFGKELDYDDKWFTFGPFDPKQGEYSPQWKGRIFKVIGEGTNGDDGNLYKYFLSTSGTKNEPITGGNAFTYEYCFRLVSRPVSIAHLYPFIDNKVVSVTQHNFDFDNDGIIRIYSVAKNGHNVDVSGDNSWTESLHQIEPSERGKSLDIRVIKKSGTDNDMVIYLTNQYDEPIPFFAIPIGGPPKYKYDIDITFERK